MALRSAARQVAAANHHGSRPRATCLQASFASRCFSGYAGCSRPRYPDSLQHSVITPRPVCRQLWSIRGLINRCPAVPEDGLGEDLSDIMKQDMERFAARQQQEQQQQQQQQSSRGYTTQQNDQAAGSSSLKDTVDKVLIADFFFILVVLAWLGAGVAEKAALHSSALVDAWMPLWPMVFQPAIGILMAGALVSGGLNWVQEQQQKKQ